MPTSPSSLRIAVLGAGNIGSAFAFQLAGVGHHDVTVIARPESARISQLQRDGAIVDVNGDRADVCVTDIFDETVPYDLVIVTVMAHRADTILPALQRSAATCIQFMFNTFDPERLQAAIGDSRCALGMPLIQAILTPNGMVRATIGAGGQKTIMSEQRTVDIFNGAGLPAVLDRNMALWLRCHVPLCVAFQSISVAGQRRAGGASWSEALVVARGIRASFELIKTLGYQIYPTTKRRIASSPISMIAATLWCMSRIRSFRELLATGKAECRALVDDMVAAAPLTTSPGIMAAIVAMKPAA